MPPILNKPPLNTGDTTYEIKAGILFIQKHVRAHFTLEKFKEITNNRIAYSEGYSYPVIIYGKDMISMDKESRDYMCAEGCKNKLSRAFVVEKTQGKLQIQFFIETNKQPIPIEVFDDLESAIKWSEQFKV
jgi:hypothetical protein